MKRQNREPEPPPKTRFTRSSSFINLPFLLSLHFPRIFLKQFSGFHQTNNKRPLWTFCVLYWFSSVGFRTRSFYNIGPILRTTSCHTCNLVKLLGRSTHTKNQQFARSRHESQMLFSCPVRNFFSEDKIDKKDLSTGR